MNIQFATQSYKSRSLPVSSQRCVNMYAEAQPQGAKTPVAVFGCPGLTSFTTCGNGPVRGMKTMAGILYVLSGTALYSVTAAGVATAVGNAVTGTGLVSMSENGTQLMIVNGTSGWVFSQAAGFQLVSNPNFFSANTVTFFDGFFVFDRKNTNQFFISGLLDGTDYTGTDFASAEVQPDYVVAIVNQQENLLIFGQQTIETWYDAGNVNFPFQRYDGATIERGCGAPLTVVKEDNSVFFLGDDLMFYRLNGVIPVRISTHAIEYEWSTYAVTSDATCWSYTFQGHKWLVLTFHTAGKTWIYDIATSLWHERESWDTNNNTYTRWRANCHAVAYGKDLVGDAFSGTVGYIDQTVYTEYGNIMEGMMIAPTIHSDRKRVFISCLELDMETGVGLTSGQGSDPQVMLSWSNDGGRSWTQPQPWNSLGKVGTYLTRLRWTRQGQARQRTYRVHISDPVKRTLISANAELSVGM